MQHCAGRFQQPDVRQLAELAEAEGVDFRVLVLHRGAAALLRSTVRHRNFMQGRWNAVALVLESPGGDDF